MSFSIYKKLSTLVGSILLIVKNFISIKEWQYRRVRMKDVILKLEQLGFSSYEAKAYYTLLRKHPANGYEISKIGKIPAAKIYDTLRLKVLL